MMARILIVDDNELNLELAHDVLELGGFEVETAESGAEGVEKARAAHPDLILMDLRMPGMSGLEAMHTLHDDEATRHIPVAVLTASAMKGEQERLLREGFDAYMQKPIDPSTFADEVRVLLETMRNG
jgi:two-component system cell cycle response regulator DivK